MTTDNLKQAILKLPDEAIEPLLDWLKDYYDGPVWDRQIVADIERLGEEEFSRRLGGGAKGSNKRRSAALRLKHLVRFRPDADRKQCLWDIETLFGGPLENRDLDV